MACSVYTTDLLLDEDDDDRVSVTDRDDPTESDATDPGPESSEPNPTTTAPGSSSGPPPPAPPTAGPAPGGAGSPNVSPDVPAEPSGPGPSPDGSGGTGAEPAPSPTDGPDGAVPTPTATEPTSPGPTSPAPEPSTPVDPNAPSEDPLIHDFDDRRTRLTGNNRAGNWFTGGDPTGTITRVPDMIQPVGAEDQLAAHVVAENFEEWGVLSVNFRSGDPPTAYAQAQQYAGIEFWACTSAAGGRSSLRFEVKTTDTAGEHGNEDNHYRIPLPLTATWKKFSFEWDDLAQDWGTLSTFNVLHVMGFQFSVDETAGGGFDLWVDNIAFIDPVSPVAAPPQDGMPCPSNASDAGTP